jgi:elongator complex protein 3
VAKERMKERDLRCRCIRCREYGHRQRDNWEIGEPHLVRTDYEASTGRELFLSFEDDQETLFGLLRLRIEPAPPPELGLNAGEPLAMIRELHVYGPEISLGEQAPNTAQHKGLGKALLKEAERIAAEFGAQEVFVLSGVGAKEYYRTEFGYLDRGAYLAKSLPHHPAPAGATGPPRCQSDARSHASPPGRSPR